MIEDGAKLPSAALINAVEFDAQKVFDFLLERNDIDINYQDEDGNTVLHHVSKGHIDQSFDYSDSGWHLKYNSFAEPLLDKGTQFDIKNKDGTTSIDLFIYSVIKNESDISFYDNALNKESINTDRICVEQRDRLSSILELFIDRGMGELERVDDGTPAFRKLSEICGIFIAEKKQNMPTQNPEVKLLLDNPKENDDIPYSTKGNKLPIITASAGSLLGLSTAYAYFVGAATIAVFVTAAMFSALIGYCFGKVLREG